MASYATTTELIARLGGSEQASYATDSYPTPDTDVLTDAIESAEGSINSRLAKRYATPVVVAGNTELTALLKRMTLDLAETYSLERGDRISEVKERQRDRVLAWADRCAKGDYVLSGAATPPTTASREPLIEWSDTTREQPDDSGRVFTRDSLSAL